MVSYMKTDFLNDPYFYLNAEALFLGHYIDALPILVTLSYLAKIFFYVRDPEKTVFCLQFLLWNGPHYLI